MIASSPRVTVEAARSLLCQRLAEPAPGRIQLLAGPRQVGKTTLLLDFAKQHDREALYAAADGPEAGIPGFWQRLWRRAEEIATAQGRAIVLLDEAHVMPGWSAHLKSEWDRIRRLGLRMHIVATGSSALRLATGSRESLAGRFERITLGHWSASALASTFDLEPHHAAEIFVRQGAYPGAFGLRDDLHRWTAYVRDAILEPAIGRDLLALAAIRKPGLLRQVFGVCAASPARIVSLQKIQGRLQDAGALETIAHYLSLLEEAFLVASLAKHSPKPTRQRASPPKLVALSNALLAAADPRGIPDRSVEGARFGDWVENACLAHAWNAGQNVSYWREEPLEVDAVVDGSWGRFAIEVTTGALDAPDLNGIAEFCRRHRDHEPLVVCEPSEFAVPARLGLKSIDWRDFLCSGPNPAPTRAKRNS